MPTEEQLHRLWESELEFGMRGLDPINKKVPSFLTQKDEPANNTELVTKEEIANMASLVCRDRITIKTLIRPDGKSKTRKDRKFAKSTWLYDFSGKAIKVYSKSTCYIMCQGSYSYLPF